METREVEGVTFGRDSKFDLQLSQALIRERKLAEVLCGGKIEKLEVKTETYQWRRTGNLAIEFRANGKPSGISTTEADVWVHQVCDDAGNILMAYWFPVPQLKRLCREEYLRGNFRLGGGDRGAFDVVLLSVSGLNQFLRGGLCR